MGCGFQMDLMASVSWFMSDFELIDFHYHHLYFPSSGSLPHDGVSGWVES